LNNKEIIIIIPAYNCEEHIEDVINGFCVFGYDICVVDDGSSDNTALKVRKHPDVVLLSNDKNAGKGAALDNGFKYAIKNNYKWALTVDGDLQHLPSDFNSFIREYEKHKDSDYIIFLGDRSLEFHKMPKSNRVGNTSSSGWLSFITRQKINDSQCGYRMYSLKIFDKIKIKAKRFGYETEFLIKASRKKAKFINVAVSAVYPENLEEFKSHYRKVKDTIRILWVLIRCLF
jgi:glycosyltransferase involved in cell wall biosynthesis